MHLKLKQIPYDSVQMPVVHGIRNSIFTREQGIPQELDLDEKDAKSIHILGLIAEEPVAVGRLTIIGKKAVLSRIAVVKKYRGNGLAAKIVRELETFANKHTIGFMELYPHKNLEDFYKKLGYKTDPEFYDEVAGHQLIRMYK